jgi:hypothetical protein
MQVLSVTVSAIVKSGTLQSRVSSSRDLRSALTWSCVLAGFLLAAAFTAAQAVPAFGVVLYGYEGASLAPGTLPLSTESKGKVLLVRLEMRLSAVHPTLFRIIPDDCLQSLTVNGKAVDDPQMGFCDYGAGRHIDLGRYIHAGANLLEAKVGDSGGRGGFSVEASPRDPVIIALFIIVLLATLWCTRMILRSVNVRSFAQAGPIWFIISGALIRLAYFIVTPFGTRAHDVDGHIEYVRYILSHWSIPPAHEGWQFYQPPLYYAAAAVWTRVWSLTGVLRDTDWMQWLAFACACATLVIAAFIAAELFPRKQETPDKLRMLFLTIGFPGLAFFAARINNDVLIAPLGFLALLFVLRFLRSSRVREWFLAIICTALAILTKTNAVLILPAVFVSLLLVPNKMLRKRLHLMIIGALLVFLICGGFFFARMRSEGRSRAVIVGNIHSLSSGLLLRNTPSSYLTFNPAGMIRQPYNQPWDDASRRQYFPEYFFRSAFFGEFDFGRPLQPMAQAVLIAWLFLLPVLAFGIYQAFRRHDPVSLVMLTAFFGVLGGHASFRFLFPYSSSSSSYWKLPIL